MQTLTPDCDISHAIIHASGVLLVIDPEVVKLLNPMIIFIHLFLSLFLPLLSPPPSLSFCPFLPPSGDGKQILCGLGDTSVLLYKSSLTGSPSVYTGIGGLPDLKKKILASCLFWCCFVCFSVRSPICFLPLRGFPEEKGQGSTEQLHPCSYLLNHCTPAHPCPVVNHRSALKRIQAVAEECPFVFVLPHCALLNQIRTDSGSAGSKAYFIFTSSQFYNHE